MNDEIITMRDCRKLDYCARGVRTFFARYELDYMDFLKNGITADKLLIASNNDGMIAALVEVVSNGGN